MDNDVILFSALRRLGHHEAIFSSERFELDPLSSAGRYRKTHSAPEDGYQAIVLSRDPLALRPWGFSCQRHEFGGACLVSSVDPLSPADAAVSTTMPLSVILCYNVVVNLSFPRRLFWELGPAAAKRHPYG
jgi:hypothetical protein